MTVEATIELTRDERLAAAKEYFNPTPCPELPWLSDDELLAALELPDGPVQVAALFKERVERIWLASDEGDPFYYGFELPHWKDCDWLQRDNDLVYCAGGKRASKSERAAKRIVQAAMKYPKGVIWCFQDNHPTSIATQQKLIWKYLPSQIKALNGKQDRRKTFAVGYTLKNGFSDGVLVLPNKTAIHFLTYNSEVTDYQGWEIGAVVAAGGVGPASGESGGVGGRKHAVEMDGDDHVPGDDAEREGDLDVFNDGRDHDDDQGGVGNADDDPDAAGGAVEHAEEPAGAAGGSHAVHPDVRTTEDGGDLFSQ